MKRCPKCKQTLPLSEFYQWAGKPSSYCKTCYREKERKRYHDKVPNVRINSHGQWIVSRGRRPVILWTGNMLSEIKRHYPTTKNEELAEIIGVSKTTLIRKARELGLSKDEEWMKQQSRQNIFVGYHVWKKRSKNN